MKEPIADFKSQLERKYELISNNAYNVSEKQFFIGVAELQRASMTKWLLITSKNSKT